MVRWLGACTPISPRSRETPRENHHPAKTDVWQPCRARNDRVEHKHTEDAKTERVPPALHGPARCRTCRPLRATRKCGVEYFFEGSSGGRARVPGNDHPVVEQHNCRDTPDVVSFRRCRALVNVDLYDTHSAVVSNGEGIHHGAQCLTRRTSWRPEIDEHEARVPRLDGTREGCIPNLAS